MTGSSEALTKLRTVRITVQKLICTRDVAFSSMAQSMCKQSQCFANIVCVALLGEAQQEESNFAERFMSEFAKELVETEDALDDSLTEAWSFKLDPITINVRVHSSLPLLLFISLRCYSLCFANSSSVDFVSSICRPGLCVNLMSIRIFSRILMTSAPSLTCSKLSKRYSSRTILSASMEFTTIVASLSALALVRGSIRS
jgi:hypothetical protein